MPIATPTIVVTSTSTGVDIQFTNSDTPTFNYLRRNGVYIGKTIANDGNFADYQTKSGEQAFYVGSAYDGTQESAPTSPKTATVTLTSALIHKVAKVANGNIASGTSILSLSNPEGETQTYSRDSNVLVLAAQEKPRIKTSSVVGRYIECPIYIKQADWKTVIPDLEEMLWSNDLYCFRSDTEDLMFCTFPSDQTLKFNTFTATMSLTLVESAYDETIS